MPCTADSNQKGCLHRTGGTVRLSLVGHIPCQVACFFKFVCIAASAYVMFVRAAGYKSRALHFTGMTERKRERERERDHTHQCLVEDNTCER